MKKNLYSIIAIFFSSSIYAQDTALTYSHVLKADSLSKNEIFDRTLIWCSKAFNDSKSAINVKERDGGIIGGKAFYLSSYMVPRKKDSISALIFTNYYFDWLIEIKENRLRFTASNIVLKELNNEYPVTTKKQAPFEVWLQAQSKTELEWKLSKESLVRNLDRLILSLYGDLIKKETDW